MQYKRKKAEDLKPILTSFTSSRLLLEIETVVKTRVWLKYLNVFLFILILKKAKENDLELDIVSFNRLCHLFFACDHTNYACFAQVYMLTS